MNGIIKLDRSTNRWPDLWAVESNSKPGEYRTVGRNSRGNWGCDCPHWINRHTDCRHIRAVKEFTARPAPAPAPAPAIVARAEKQFDDTLAKRARFLELDF